jgi:elongator complex protein 3
MLGFAVFKKANRASQFHILLVYTVLSKNMSTKSPSSREQSWLDAKRFTPDKYRLALKALEEIRNGEHVFEAIRHHPLPDGEGFLGKSALVSTYRDMVNRGEWKDDPALLAKIRLKPMRTLSGVTTVTVLTKPYPCPGECIFCPDDVRMPKSYLPDEPGAMRALYHDFDPYDQVAARIETLHNVGHPTEKIELLILGGTWSAYRADYQEWFIRRCLDAMNQVESPTLEAAQSLNENASHRNVGLVVETRPDSVNPKELAWLRRLGVTKIQMGVQSTDNHILEVNKRGHTFEETEHAVALMRAAGFKIVLHWMPNLLGATPESDKNDFARFLAHLAPDEIKIYPTQLLEGTELHSFWEGGAYEAYTTETLVNLIADIKPTIPQYCRVNRVIRDIPSTHVVAGNKRTSLRQDVQRELNLRGKRCGCIRCREVRSKNVEADDLRLDDLIYRSGGAEEHFISWITPGGKLAGFLRLSLPSHGSHYTGMADLKGAAVIREVHIYGQSLGVGEAKVGAAQHSGLGTNLLKRAEEIARAHGFDRIAVISAIGTRQYYLDRGFQRGDLYMVKDI